MASDSTSAAPQDTLHCVKDIAARLGVTPACVYALAKAGRLPYHRVGLGRGAIRISEKDVQAFLAESRVDANDKKAASAPAQPKLKHITL